MFGFRRLAFHPDAKGEQWRACCLGGALAGNCFFVYGLGPNPRAGENGLHFSIFGHFSKFSEL
jgi:hypothetical protein